ncbi:hypothetical protein INT45_001597 [Circinella minor]|uniref:RBR-type E3 ubiquitin transferase n=1 Tax=Circinella minor TaxID=1195481 RepID=A0A8H7S411_9FUNG|nr:hypothetical protein INT45_001597 [Circinella minor]
MNQLGDVVSTLGCEHYACYECLKNYFRSYLDRPGVEDYSILDCPGQNCDKVFITDDVLPRIMPNMEDIHYWWRSVIEKTFMDSIGYCPYPDCLGSFELPLPEQLDEYKQQQQVPIIFSAPSSSRSIPEPQQINEKDTPLFAECLECNRGICLTCHGTWHPGTANWKQHDDTYYRESLANKRKKHQRALSIEARNLAQKNQWTRCPKCKEMVERKSGCLTILCRCGTSLCGARSNVHNYCNCQNLPPGRVQAMRQPMFTYN